MKTKKIGNITDPEILKILGFSETTSLKDILNHWYDTERKYEANVYRATNIKKESLLSYSNRDLKHSPFKELK